MQWGPIFTKESNAIQSLAMQCSCSSIAISPRLNAMEGFFQKPSWIILSSCSAAGVLSALFDISAPRSLCCIISQLTQDQFLTRSGPTISQVTQDQYLNNSFGWWGPNLPLICLQACKIFRGAQIYLQEKVLGTRSTKSPFGSSNEKTMYFVRFPVIKYYVKFARYLLQLKIIYTKIYQCTR